MIRRLFALIFVVSLLFGANVARTEDTRPKPPPMPRRIIPFEAHDHQWDDLRVLPVIVLGIRDGLVVWVHSGEAETRTGTWTMTEALGKEVAREKGVKGSKRLGIYCGVCDTAFGLYEWR